MASTGSAVTVPRRITGPTVASRSADVVGPDLDDVAAGRLGEQRRRQVVVGQAVDRGPEPAGDAQLGEGDGEPALADVVARLDEAGRGSPRAGGGSAAGASGSGCGTAPGSAGAPSTRSRWLPANSAAVRPSSTSTLPGAVSSAVTVRPTSGTWATAVITSVGGTAWRRPSAPTYSLFSESLPDTNGAPWAIAASWHPRTAATSSPSVLGAARVAPREVVEQGDAVGIGADGDDVADRLVDHGVGHRLGVVQRRTTG